MKKKPTKMKGEKHRKSMYRQRYKRLYGIRIRTTRWDY